MQENIQYAYAWKSTRQQNRFTAYATDGTEYSFTVSQAPKSIKTVGGVVKFLHDNIAHGEAYKITKALKQIEQRITCQA